MFYNKLKYFNSSRTNRSRSYTAVCSGSYLLEELTKTGAEHLMQLLVAACRFQLELGVHLPLLVHL